MIIIFKNYTGNAMLNNALMTIEALAGLKSIDELSISVLKKLFNEKKLAKVNKRLKCYTMLFTKNGPLHNDVARGEKIYIELMQEIMENFENDGNITCEISGLKFNRTFRDIFEKSLRNVGLNEKEIEKKDTNIGRTWFPLIGGLGSDAQALPQAKFTVQIHPICILILQFLPLSSILYKGGILLVDSSNFDFSKAFIKNNSKVVLEKIELTKNTDQIENIKDFNKGDYIIKCLEILEQLKLDNDYSELNLWSFSNSGTGASCEIDRLPNSLIRKLQFLNRKVKKELHEILIEERQEYDDSFINKLNNNEIWYKLFPNIFGSGKKTVVYEGVSIEFFEAYLTIIDRSSNIIYAKYISNLIRKYGTNKFKEYLIKTDAHNDKNYHIDLFATLVESTKNKEWSIYHHLNILDNPTEVPLKNHFYQILRIIHFFYQKNETKNIELTLNVDQKNLNRFILKVIRLIDNDINKDKVQKEIIERGDSFFLYLLEIILKEQSDIEEDLINFSLTFLWNESYKLAYYGLQDLLRIYYENPIKLNEQNDLNVEVRLLMNNEITWLNKIEMFCHDYLNYYSDKYSSSNGDIPINKIKNLIGSIPNQIDKYIFFLREAIENCNNDLNSRKSKNRYELSDLICDADGNINYQLSQFILRLKLTQRVNKINSLIIK